MGTMLRRARTEAEDAVVRTRLAGGALGVGLVLVAAFAITLGGPAEPAMYLVVAAYGVGLACLGVRRMPPAHRRVWWALAAGQVLFLGGDVLWTLFENVLHIDPYPSAADASFLAGYVASAFGMWLLFRARRRRGQDRAALLDAAILTTGCAVVGITFFVAPAAASGGESLLSQAVAAAYPIGDLLLLFLVVRLLTGGMALNLSSGALIGSLLVLLVADLSYVMSVLGGESYAAWIDLGYLLSYLLFGFATVHPSVRDLAGLGPEKPVRITPARLMLLGAAMVLAPATDQIAHLVDPSRARGSWTVLVGGVLGAVLVVLRMWGLVQALERKAVQLAALARKDSLTGIANRRTWDHELSRACAFARDHGTPLTAAVLDLDHFKRFNDTHGHLMGDLVLKETTAAWTSLLGDSGFVARFGGEEFTVLLPETDITTAEAVLHRLRRAVPREQTCSVGVAVWDGTESPADLVARADEALYHAKREGRDRIAVHDGRSARTSAAPETSPVEASLKSVYQPMVDLRTGEQVAFEALSRFDGHSTQEVFETAARLGTAATLESAAIRSALVGWGVRPRISVNASLSCLTTPELQAALPHDLSTVIVEITEADFVALSPEVTLALDDLRARGALLAIDDVGVGFSNLQRVASLRPDIVKLDMSLIRGVDSDPGQQAVVTAAVHYVRETGAVLVAEGIETEAERDYLASVGVTWGQGYLLGRPSPASAWIPAVGPHPGHADDRAAG